MDKQTIEFYNKNASSYAESTINLDISEQQLAFVNQLPLAGKILDAGCGSGRDLAAFKNLGFEAVGIDASKELVEIAKNNSKANVYEKTFDQIDWKNEFDGVWCMASLLHLNRTELKEALFNISAALKPNGKLYASFKSGEGESYDNKGRFFSYHSIKDLKDIFDEIKVFGNVNFSYGKDTMGRDDTQWINVNCNKEKPEINLKKTNRLKM